MDDELPQLSAEEKAKYTSFWSGYFKKGSKSSQSLDSETLPAPVTPATSVPAPSTPDTLETLIQRARDDPSLRAMLLSSLGASPAPTDSRLPEPPQPLPTAAPVALTPVPSPDARKSAASAGCSFPCRRASCAESGFDNARRSCSGDAYERGSVTSCAR